MQPLTNLSIKTDVRLELLITQTYY